MALGVQREAFADEGVRERREATVSSIKPFPMSACRRQSPASSTRVLTGWEFSWLPALLKTRQRAAVKVWFGL
jgi:hypothetical protein